MKKIKDIQSEVYYVVKNNKIVLDRELMLEEFTQEIERIEQELNKK